MLSSNQTLRLKDAVERLFLLTFNESLPEDHKDKMNTICFFSSRPVFFFSEEIPSHFLNGAAETGRVESKLLYQVRHKKRY